MEQKLNMAEILKDKPVGLKLYRSTFGYIKFNGVHKDKVYFYSEDTNVHSVKLNGKMYDGGECIIFPSKEMRDWSKFSWKRGDVLVSSDGSIEVIFDKWYDDTYTSFYCKHYLNSEDKNKIVYYEEFLCTTAKYSLEDKDAVQTYIKTIEEKLGGKFNRETLEIEKQQEFKDGDIITITTQIGNILTFIFRAEDVKKYYCHAFLYGKIVIANDDSFCKKDFYIARQSTEEEKQQLFDALAKEGKYWDAEKKQIVDLKPKIELKPFDKVLVRDGKDEIWEPAFFFRNRPELNVYKYQTVGGKLRVYCIPFNEETAKLIGTSNDWKG